MRERNGSYASQLRQELCLRNRQYAVGCAHVESYGRQPVIVYAPDDGRHGNFFDPAYAAIYARPELLQRLNKIHAQAARSLPRHEAGRRWCELDSSTSSDALLMNVFCTPGVVESPRVRQALGLAEDEPPVFGWKARVPLKNGRGDRTEVDLRWGGLMVEAKLTETDFQTRSAAVVEGYQDFDEVFDRELLPRVELKTARQKAAVEFPEEFSQEWEASDLSDDEINGGSNGMTVVHARKKDKDPAAARARRYGRRVGVCRIYLLLHCGLTSLLDMASSSEDYTRTIQQQSD